MRKIRRRVRRPQKAGAWPKSDQFRDIARRAITEWNMKRDDLPKCGAKGRKTGEPCRHVAMANGRCYVHGGRTPKGDDWHRPRWPDGDAPNAEVKLARKLRDMERSAKKRATRLAKMTPEERERHAHWQRTHKPGSPRKRAAEREYRRQNADAAKMLENKRADVDPAVVDLQRAIDELERRAAAISFDIFG